MNSGIVYSLASATLFGLSVPLAKAFVGPVPPWLLAGVLYLGSGVGLAAVLLWQRLARHGGGVLVLPHRGEWRWLAGAILFGGIAGPAALMHGLALTTASAASLLLNLEAVFTALFAWFAFGENYDRRVMLGMAAIVAGGLALAWAPGGLAGDATGALLVTVACIFWALDNNLTRKVAASDAVFVAGLKGLAAGSANLALALFVGQSMPAATTVTALLLVGFLGYGVSLVLFVLGLRHLGTARAAAYFSVAPFVGAAFAVAVQGEALSWPLAVAGVLMGTGVWLHVSERHAHEHLHEAIEHDHLHRHDEHHQHEHRPGQGREPHAHRHVHEPLVHVHPHFPDVHHRHPH